jgi:hypothetical protein
VGLLHVVHGLCLFRRRMTARRDPRGSPSPPRGASGSSHPTGRPRRAWRHLRHRSPHPPHRVTSSRGPARIRHPLPKGTHPPCRRFPFGSSSSHRSRRRYGSGSSSKRQGSQAPAPRRSAAPCGEATAPRSVRDSHDGVPSEVADTSVRRTLRTSRFPGNTRGLSSGRRWHRRCSRALRRRAAAPPHTG